VLVAGVIGALILRAAFILAAVAVKLLAADIYTFPARASPAFIAAVLAAVTALSVHGSHRPAAHPPAPPVLAGATQHSGGTS
jgi:hypothetical protein